MINQSAIYKFLEVSKNLVRKKAKKVVWTYNHSKYYVNIIFKISDKLKG